MFRILNINFVRIVELIWDATDRNRNEEIQLCSDMRQGCNEMLSRVQAGASNSTMQVIFMVNGDAKQVPKPRLISSRTDRW
jgi:hypothetical protein